MTGVKRRITEPEKTCQFCENQRTLIKAHIIPEGFFRRLDDNGGPNRLLSEEDYPQKSRIGPYDPDILCEPCDNVVFGKWDHYTQMLLGKSLKNSSPIIAKDGIIGWECADFNYASFKLFFISLLWRASISKNSFFDGINLGPFEAEAKELLKSEDAGDPETFAVFLAKFDEPLGEAVLGPYRERIDGINHCTFYLGGYIAHIKVDKRECARLSDFIVDPNKPLRIIKRQLVGSGEALAMLRIIQAPQNHLHQRTRRSSFPVTFG